MKVVIIGGGIAGLSTAVLFQKENFETVVCERRKFSDAVGLAFLITTESINTIESLNPQANQHILKNTIDDFQLRSTTDECRVTRIMQDWHALRRSEIVNYLLRLVPTESQRENCVFDHFLFDNEKAIAAVFADGHIEYGDLFVGADGANSSVRTTVCDAAEFNSNDINEIVCIAPRKTTIFPINRFIKYQAEDKGLSFGMVPLANDEKVCFFQYDNRLFQKSDTESLESFSERLAQEFPTTVTEAVKRFDFSQSHLWKARDLKLLPNYFKENIVLIGDAAHVSLPLTSAGVSEAIVDAKVLVGCLVDHPIIGEALARYETIRKPEIEKIITLASHLKDQFMDGIGQLEESYSLPLLEQK